MPAKKRAPAKKAGGSRRTGAARSAARPLGHVVPPLPKPEPKPEPKKPVPDLGTELHRKMEVDRQWPISSPLSVPEGFDVNPAWTDTMRHYGWPEDLETQQAINRVVIEATNPHKEN